MDYNILKQTIINYTNRNEPVFIASIPTIIEQALNSIYSDVRTIGFQKTTISPLLMKPNIPYLPKPIDYKSTINFQYTNADSETVFLLPRSYEFCINYWPDITKTSAPLYYSADLDVPQNDDAQALFYITPTPDIAYPYQLTYLSFPPVFNEANSKNFLTDKYPDLLIYGCLVKAIPFLKSDERTAMFESLYAKAVQRANKDTSERYIDRTTQRNID